MSVEDIVGSTEAEAERRRLMKEKPEEFFHQSEIIVAAVKKNGGIGILTGAVPRHEMEIAMVRIWYKTMEMFTQMDMAKFLKDKESEIVTAPDAGKIIV
jgi:hypothetical protein